MKLMVSQKVSKTGDSMTVLLIPHFALALPYKPKMTTAMTPLVPAATHQGLHLSSENARNKPNPGEGPYRAMNFRGEAQLERKQFGVKSSSDPKGSNSIMGVLPIWAK